MKYTKDRHAENLLVLLEDENPCGYCPLEFDEKISGDISDLCTPRIFRGFINLPVKSGCPCLALGKQEAIKRTWIALEDGGYLE